MVLVVVANLHFGLAPDVAFRDINAIARAPWYYGVISNLGIVAWVGAAAVLLFAYAVRRIHGLTRTAPSRMLLEFGLLTMLLALDDLLMLHEGLFESTLGISERWVLAAYVLLTATLLVRHRDTILGSEHALLAIALLCFAVSVVLDVFVGDFRGEYVIEDGLKLAGIATWLAYFGRVALGATRNLRA